MCHQGDTTVLLLAGRPIDVDSCIADLVRALNGAGIRTVACCCGHGKRPGAIALVDGRELIIAPDYATGRLVDAAFPPLHAPPLEAEGQETR